MGKLGPKGQEEKPRFGFVAYEAPCFSVPNVQEETTEGYLREAKSEAFFHLHSFEFRAPVGWLGSHAVAHDYSGFHPDGS